MDLDEFAADPQRVEPWRLDDETLLALLPALSTRMRQLDALRVRLAHEAHERCLNQKVGASSTAAWLSGACRLTPAHAKRILTTAHALRHHPDVAAAFTTGTVDIDQARSITNLLDRIPDLLSVVEPQIVDGEPTDPVGECTQQCTDYLVAAAETEHAVDTAHRATALATMLEQDHDGPEPDDENDALNEFHASQMPGGRFRVKGHFDKATGEQLMTALSALSKPQPGRTNTHGEPDPDDRTPGQRRADGFADIVRHYLDCGTAPGEGGERPHLTVFVGLDDLTAATRNTHRDNNSDHDDTGHTDHRPRSFIRRGPAWMPWLGAVSTRLAAVVSCDATITAIVMDDNGNPLDVGRTTRLIPRRLRRALDARDCGCTFLPQALRAGGTPRLWPPRRLDRRPPHPPLVARRRDDTVEPRPALPFSPQTDPQG